MPVDAETAFSFVVPGLRTSIPNFELNEGSTCNKLTAADRSEECYIICTRKTSYLSDFFKLAIEAARVKSGRFVSYHLFNIA
jgi:hypothetical protein